MKISYRRYLANLSFTRYSNAPRLREDLFTFFPGVCLTGVAQGGLWDCYSKRNRDRSTDGDHRASFSEVNIPHSPTSLPGGRAPFLRLPPEKKIGTVKQIGSSVSNFLTIKNYNL